MKFAIQELIFGAGMLASLIDLIPACPYTYTMLEFKNLSLSKSKFFRFRIRNSFCQKKNKIYPFLKVKVKFKGQSKTTSIMFKAITRNYQEAERN